jgi:hypothetical protein
VRVIKRLKAGILRKLDGQKKVFDFVGYFDEKCIDSKIQICGVWAVRALIIVSIPIKAPPHL